MIFKLLDSNFAHHKYSKLSTDEQYLENFSWDRNITNTTDLIVVTDFQLHTSNVFNNKIAWILEPKTICNHIYNYIKNNNKNFKYVFTHDKELLDLKENYKFVPVGGSWIFKNDQIIYPKTKLLSIIASNKRQSEGHRLRHEIIDKFRSKLDIYGRGINTIQYKLDGLKDYMFSIVVENGNYDYYFTEKLIDCFVTGTVPIYWGCPSIGDFFNLDGILKFENISEFENILNNLTESKYIDMMKAINDNFERTKNYLLSEDFMIKNNLI